MSNRLAIFRRVVGLWVILLIISFSGGGNYAQTLIDDDGGGIPLNKWAVELAPGVDPQQVARQTGMIYAGAVPNLPGIHIFTASPARTGGVWARGAMSRDVQIDADLLNVPGVRFAEQQIARQMFTRSHTLPADPQFPNQWHLQNTGQGGGTVGIDANVIPAWHASFTGDGVVIAIVDEGLEYTHPDIAPNYAAALSYDYYDNDNNPIPMYAWESHGTNVAGVAAAARDGDTCGVGAAYSATLAGLRLIAGPTDDEQEASALAHRLDAVHVSNNSWGPNDNGKSWGGAESLALAAIANGATNGRGGKGIVYVWAGGNGGTSDYTTADGFVNSRYTLGIAATTNTGVTAWYSERGSNLVVNAPTSGGTEAVTTTGLGGGCNTNFGGTSSAAPLVAGVVALMLEANPNLTWRDVQAILIETAIKNDPANSGWLINGAGYDYHHAYAFGRVNAGAAVAMAQTWVNLAPENSIISPVASVNAAIPDNNPAGVEHTIFIPQNVRIESVEAVLNISHQRRGNLRIQLISPAGTVSNLLEPRSPDTSGDGIVNYPILSTHFFGESAEGNWTLRVIDTVAGSVGTLQDWQLRIHGVEIPSSGENLLQNSSFEVAGAGGQRTADQWKLKHPMPKDRRVVDKPDKDKYTAFTGDYAFRLRSEGVYTRARLIQKVVVGLQPGDVLEASISANAKNMQAGAYVRVIVRYASGGKETFDIPFAEGTYTTTESILIPITGLTSEIRYQVRFIQPHGAASRLWIDDATLIYNPAPAPDALPDTLPLPLPSAP